MARWKTQMECAGVADEATGHADQPVSQGGDHGLAVADAVSGQPAVGAGGGGEVVQPAGDADCEQSAPEPCLVDLGISRGECRNAAPSLASRKMFSIAVRCRYQCATAAALSGVDTSRLVTMN